MQGTEAQSQQVADPPQHSCTNSSLQDLDGSGQSSGQLPIEEDLGRWTFCSSCVFLQASADMQCWLHSHCKVGQVAVTLHIVMVSSSCLILLCICCSFEHGSCILCHAYFHAVVAGNGSYVCFNI